MSFGPSKAMSILVETTEMRSSCTCGDCVPTLPVSNSRPLLTWYFASSPDAVVTPSSNFVPPVNSASSMPPPSVSLTFSDRECAIRGFGWRSSLNFTP